jgi:flagellar basal-body rod protein FlgB
VQGLETKHDGNNVSVDREAKLLAENGLRFQAASAMLKMQIRQVRTAIMEGRGA